MRDVSRCRSFRSSRKVPPTVGVENPGRERAKAAYTWASEGSRGPHVGSKRFGQSPVGLAAGGEGFAHASGIKAHPKRTMRAHRVRTFRAPPVVLRHDARTGPLATHTSRPGLSS